MNDAQRRMTVQQETALLLYRMYSSQVADLAIQLAQKAGEEASRPLSEAQIARALQAMDAEFRLVRRHVFEHSRSMIES